MLIWNVAGWLVFGLVLNHAHTHGEGSYCEITFCSCQVDEGQRICFCHHHNLHQPDNNARHGDTHHGEHNTDMAADLHDACYFSIPLADSNSTTQALIVLIKFNALHQNASELSVYESGEYTHPYLSESINPGKPITLLRPPRA